MTTMTAAQIRAQTASMAQTPDPQVPERPRPPRQYSAAYKLRILAEYERLNKAGTGALLRREGLYTSLISEWRKQRDRGALAALGEAQRRGRHRPTPTSGNWPGCRPTTPGCVTSWPARPRCWRSRGNSPRCRNQRALTAGDTPHDTAASSLDSLRAIASQKRCRC